MDRGRQQEKTADQQDFAIPYELQKTGDWVVVYFHTDAEPEAQCTVVTETRGPLEGRRVIRGREGDCLAHYAEIQRSPGAETTQPIFDR